MHIWWANMEKLFISADTEVQHLANGCFRMGTWSKLQTKTSFSDKAPIYSELCHNFLSTFVVFNLYN